MKMIRFPPSLSPSLPPFYYSGQIKFVDHAERKNGRVPFLARGGEDPLFAPAILSAHPL